MKTFGKKADDGTARKNVLGVADSGLAALKSAEAAQASSQKRAETREAVAPTEAASRPRVEVVSASGRGDSGAQQKARDDLRAVIFRDLIDTIDLTELARMEQNKAKAEVADIGRSLMQMHQTTLDYQEQELVLNEIINDVLGLGPLETLLARDDIADIMVCGPNKVYIEVGGKLQLTEVRFRDEAQLINICRRIVSAVGRRIDESSPICDARLADGSRVAIVAPPLSIDGTSLTIRKFKKEKLGLDDLVKFGSISKAGARILQIASTSRCNILVSGGTGSGKTTLLNCLTRYIDPGEAIITCEDAAELQLQQPNVRRWETRPPNLEGVGEITMSALVKAALRHRPERIIIGEVRGKEAFDLLQAMNTGHDGSAGTVHANSPREAIGRLESMIAQGGFTLPAKTVREMIVASVDLVVQAMRLRDGSRKITHITEVVGLENETVTLQDLVLFEHTGEDERGKIIGRHRSTGMRPHFFEKARYYGLDHDLMQAMQDNT
jgi:pilus assembly protein CpaF